MPGQVGHTRWSLLPQEDRGRQIPQGGAAVPQEARLRRCLQEPRGGFAGTLVQRRLTKRSREPRLYEVRCIEQEEGSRLLRTPVPMLERTVGLEPTPPYGKYGALQSCVRKNHTVPY